MCSFYIVRIKQLNRSNPVSTAQIDPCPNKVHSHKLHTRTALQPAVFAHKFRVRPSSPVAEAPPPGIEIFRTLLVLSAAEASGVEGPGSFISGTGGLLACTFLLRVLAFLFSSFFSLEEKKQKKRCANKAGRLCTILPRYYCSILSYRHAPGPDCVCAVSTSYG